MELILIRHAIAVPRGTPGIHDSARPLTPEGERSFRAAAKGLARMVGRPDALLTSPLPRARRTAEIAAGAWGKIVPQDLPALASDDFETLQSSLAAYPEHARVALVGHEPNLSSLLARLVGSSTPGPLTFRKGGAALVELQGRHLKAGTLVWFLPPKVLRKLGKS